MSDRRDTLREVAWYDVFPGLRLFSALWIAVHYRAILLAVAALILTAAGWQTCGSLFANSDDRLLQDQIAQSGLWPWERPVDRPLLGELTSADGLRLHAPLLVAWRHVSMPFRQIYRADINLVQFAYWSAGALWSLVVWAFFGGAITRLAAVSFARQENQSWVQVLGFARSRWGSYFVAPLFPILATFAIAAVLALLGWAMRSDLGVLVAGVVWPLALMMGFLMAFMLIGLFVGWPLMWATISAEGTDSFGALSHAYSYAYQRPVRYLWYVVAAAFIGLLGLYAVSIFAHWTLELSLWGVSWGTGQERMFEIANRSELGSEAGDQGVSLIAFWNNCLLMIVLAFIYSFFWSAVTVIYFLLRQLVDAKELDVVFLPGERDVHGLPPLKTGPDGVPEPADLADAAPAEPRG